MNVCRMWWSMVGLLLPCLTGGFAAEPNGGQEAAIASIKKSGGYIFRRGDRLDAIFVGSQVTDADLAGLKELDNLKRVGLGATQFTDAGLKHCRNLNRFCSAIHRSATQV